MLESLRQIVQEVNAAANLRETLDIMVGRIKSIMKVDACSVYLSVNAQREHLLMATAGLNPASVLQVRIPVTQGLIGLVREKAEPINLEDAQQHPQYRFIAETDEAQYHAFLGVPIIHQRKCLGVLVIRQRQCRLFEEDEVSFLVTLAAQLAGTIMHAASNGSHPELFNASQQIDGFFINGLAGSPGIALGTVKVIYPPFDLEAIPDRDITDTEAEIQRFIGAVNATQDEMETLSLKIAPSLPVADRALFDAYLLILKSDTLIGETISRINEGQWAPAALRDTIYFHARRFKSMADHYFKERAGDLEDLGRRILKHLQSDSEVSEDFPERTVLVTENVSAALLAEVPPMNLAGVVSAEGSGSSHVAILARAMGVPAVMGISDLPVSRMDGQTIVVDGYVGRVYISPSDAMIREFSRLAREEEEMAAGIEALNDLPAVTLDNVHIPLYANTGLLSDITPSLSVGAEGIGLYRTEFPFLIRDRFPGEEEQRNIYRQVLQTFSPKPVVLRTLDIGGDKRLPYFPIEDANPFLGWRGIRVTLDHPEIFLTQLRAMMRAGAGLDNLHILLPMVSNLSEVDEALKLIDKTHDELKQQDETITRPRVGVMIEVPSAVYMADNIARRVDFLSVGTNDLTQYLLAVDRNNSRVASLYDALDPAVLRALVHVLDAAHTYGKPVSVCGEMAGDPAASLLLIGMGIDSLSMSANSLPRIKWVIQSFSRTECVHILRHALRMEDARTIRSYLYSMLEQAELGGLVRAGK